MWAIALVGGLLIGALVPLHRGRMQVLLRAAAEADRRARITALLSEGERLCLLTAHSSQAIAADARGRLIKLLRAIAEA